MGGVSPRPYQNQLNPEHGPPPSPESRRAQAEKIRNLLVRYSRRPLTTLNCLDIGCFSGLMTAELAPLFRATCGVDYDWHGLRDARPNPGHGLDFVRADAMRLPFRDAAFQLVLCTHTHEHVPDDRLLFREMHRVLEPGGLAFLSAPNWLFPIEPHYFVPFLHWLPARMADHRLQRLGGPPHYYERMRTWWGLRRELRGFDILDLTPEVARGELMARRGIAARVGGSLPQPILRLLTPLMPSFNLLLTRRA